MVKFSKRISAPKNAKSVSVTIFVNSSNRISIAYSGFYIGEQRIENEKIEQRKTVTMFVFNNFNNDTRVLREAKSLAELGLRVRIIAVLASGQKINDVCRLFDDFLWISKFFDVVSLTLCKSLFRRSEH